ESLAHAERLLRKLELPFQWRPNLGPLFRSLHVAGGGKIANILACMSEAGHRVRACGVVGDDWAAARVIDDLRTSGLGTKSVISLPRKNPRVVFLLHKEGSDKRKQVHRKGTRPAIFPRELLESMPRARVLLV